ncbi:MAG TPA: hypothetical protein DCW86_01965 [Actinobacteria bacterium]|nr:hypothetical protein [Actinomycetota bacterium]
MPVRTARKINRKSQTRSHPRHQLGRTLRVVKSKRKTRRREREISPFGVFMALTLLLAAITMLNVSQRALVIQTALRAEQLKGMLQAEEADYKRLLLEVSRLKSPERIEGIAAEKLGMVHPPRLSYIILPGNAEEEKPASVPFKGSCLPTPQVAVPGTAGEDLPTRLTRAVKSLSFGDLSADRHGAAAHASSD